MINDQHVLVSGGIVHHEGGCCITNQELVPLDGNIIMSSQLRSSAQFGHCMVQLNKSSILITGGIFFGKDDIGKTTVFQNFETNQEENGPELLIKRFHHACGKVKINGETVVFVVSGNDGHGRKTQYLSLDSDDPKWVYGKVPIQQLLV